MEYLRVVKELTDLAFRCKRYVILFKNRHPLVSGALFEYLRQLLGDFLIAGDSRFAIWIFLEKIRPLNRVGK
ncbi:MAG: hypothetical protein A3G81_07810 [Betaproteobacteria bacterium RIFCSPLOWO2_12_FULL_65_14]|nr:MAG: hypothetical protein A3G81_07810 [Betaproteobacteria bacterium RIFCSPLOWO2_12_FULL_65_14]